MSDLDVLTPVRCRAFASISRPTHAPTSKSSRLLGAALAKTAVDAYFRRSLLLGGQRLGRSAWTPECTMSPILFGTRCALGQPPLIQGFFRIWSLFFTFGTKAAA